MPATNKQKEISQRSPYAGSPLTIVQHRNPTNKGMTENMEIVTMKDNHGMKWFLFLIHSSAVF